MRHILCQCPAHCFTVCVAQHGAGLCDAYCMCMCVQLCTSLKLQPLNDICFIFLLHTIPNRKLFLFGLLCIPIRTIFNLHMHSNGVNSLITFYIAFLMSKELKRSSLIGSHPTDCLTYCYVHNVAHLLRIFIEVFLLRKKTWLQKTCLSLLSLWCFWRSWQLYSVSLCVCMCVCVCESALRMFSHSYRHVLGCASAPAFS